MNPKTRVLRTSLILASLLLTAGLVQGANDDRHDRRDQNNGRNEQDRGRNDQNNDRRDNDRNDANDRNDRQHRNERASIEYRFQDQHRASVRSYYEKQYNRGRCPPGLSKKYNNCIPPGHVKKWSVGQRLPRDVVYYDLPPALVVEIGPPPRGSRYVRVASDILLIAIGTGLVIDAIDDLDRR